MYSFQGWVSIPAFDTGHGDPEPSIPRLEARLAEYRLDGFREAHLSSPLNGTAYVVSVAGCRNRRHPQPLDLFHWLAGEYPWAHGLLYIHDAESAHDNEYRVWRLCRGALSEHADRLLSPLIPIVEDPYDPEVDD